MADTELTPAQLAEFDQMLELGIATSMAIAAQLDDVALPEAMATMSRGCKETTVRLLGTERAVDNLSMQVAGLALRLRRRMAEDPKALRIALERITQAAEQHLMTDGDEARNLELRVKLGEAVADASLVLYPTGGDRG